MRAIGVHGIIRAGKLFLHSHPATCSGVLQRISNCIIISRLHFTGGATNGKTDPQAPVSPASRPVSSTVLLCASLHSPVSTSDFCTVSHPAQHSQDTSGVLSCPEVSGHLRSRSCPESGQLRLCINYSKLVDDAACASLLQHRLLCPPDLEKICESLAQESLAQESLAQRLLQWLNTYATLLPTHVKIFATSK